MKCPNCDRELDPNKPHAQRLPEFVHSNPNLGHGEDCMLRAFLVAIAEREDHPMEGLRLEPVDIDAFWDRVNPITDWLEKSLGLKPSEPTVVIRRVPKAKCDDCGRIWDEDDLNVIHNLGQRLDPGGTVPSGECPECCALCYPITKGD